VERQLCRIKSLIAQKRDDVESALDEALAQSEELSALLESALAESSTTEGMHALREEITERQSEQRVIRELVGARKREHVTR